MSIFKARKVIVKNFILSVGFPSFPLGLAQVQRQLLMAKAIMLEGFEVTVLCRYGTHSKEDGVASKGVFEGINYIYCSGSALRPDGFIKRTILKIYGLIMEIKYMWKFSKTKQLTGILISTNSFYNILLYYLIGRIFKVTTTVDNVEYWTSNKDYKGFERINRFLYDKFYFLFTDKIICISDFLINKVRYSKREKVIKIPAITDFEKFRISKNNSRLVRKKYFLYCGSDLYFEVIDFVISSYEKLKLSSVELILITKGNYKLQNRIHKSEKRNSIIIKSNLSYSDLISFYINSEALLIPMRNTDQDKARFPHKISEYCASCRPIITNNIGEIKNYFNETNAYLCADYDEQEFANAMQRIISEPDQAMKIAFNSYQVGIINFNYKSYSKSLIKLFSNK